MAWLAVNKDGLECLYPTKPFRTEFNEWCSNGKDIDIPEGSIKKLIGKTNYGTISSKKVYIQRLQ